LILVLAVVAMSALAQQPEAEWNEVPPQTNLMEKEHPLDAKDKAAAIDAAKDKASRVAMKDKTEHLIDCGFRAAFHAYASDKFKALNPEDEHKITAAMNEFMSKGDEADWSKELLVCLKGNKDLKNCALPPKTVAENFDGVDAGTNTHRAFYDATEKVKAEIAHNAPFLALVTQTQKEDCRNDHLLFSKVTLDISKMEAYDEKGDPVSAEKLKKSQAEVPNTGQPTTAMPSATDPLPAEPEMNAHSGEVLLEDSPTPNCDACMQKQHGDCSGSNCDYKTFKNKCITEQDTVKTTKECAPGVKRFEHCLDTCKVEAATELPTGENKASMAWNPSSDGPRD